MSRLLSFGSPNQSTFTTAILLKDSSLNAQAIERYYLDYLAQRGVDTTQIVGISLDYTRDNKAPMKTVIEPCIERVLKMARHMGVKNLFTCDANYFKKLSGERKAEPNIGLVFNCKIAGYEGMKVMYGINHSSIHHNPDNGEKLVQSVQALKNHLGGKLVKLGSDIIHHEEYPLNTLDIRKFLDKCMAKPRLYMDLETFSLRVNQAYIGTCGIAWSKHEGGAFPVDAVEIPTLPGEAKPQYLERKENPFTRQLLKDFLTNYQGEIVWHNANYDLKILVWELFMESDVDYAGMNHGIKVLTRGVHDTKIISYLALNSCGAESSRYSLKVLAQPFAGNFAESEISDIRYIPLPRLLRYNLVDCLSTAYVFDKYYDRMVADDQLGIYNEMMLPSVYGLLKTELVGMPISMARVDEVDIELGALQFESEQKLRTNPWVCAFEAKYAEALAVEYNATHKKKQKTPQDFIHYRLNPNSGDQVGDMLFEVMGLPILETTPSGKPSTSGDVLEKLENHTSDPTKLEVLHCLKAMQDIQKIRGTFIKAFREYSILKSDGNWYLHGGFNLGGTVSGRLSSSSPNLQNLPSGSAYGKLIKSCFQSNDKWLFCGADYASLEDRVDTLLTKDTNKLKVYIDGYDGHSLRAYYYFGDKMPDIYMAPEDPTVKAYKANVGGTDICFLSTDTINYEGKIYTGDEFYEAFTCSGV